MDFAKWISFCSVIILIYIIWQVRKILLLVFTAVVLAITLNLLVEKLCKLGLKRGYGVIIATVTFLVAIALFFVIIVPSLVFQFQELLTLLPQGIDKIIFQIENIKNNLSPEISDSFPDLEDILPQVQPIISDLLTRGFNFVSGFLGALLSGVLLIALTLMFLVEPTPYKQGFVRLFPAFYRRRIGGILNRTEKDLEEWLTDTFIKIIAVSILTFIVLFILGIPLIAVQALLAGILSFTPYIGPIFSVIFPVAIAFIYSPWKPWAILIIYILIFCGVDRIIIPKLRPHRVNLIPANIIIAEVIFASFLGLLGLFLVVPLTIISQILLEEILIKDIFDHWQRKN